MEDAIKEYQLKSFDKEPSYLTRILTTQFFQNYYYGFDYKDSAKDLISEFYIMHYGGKSMEDEKISKIIDTFDGDIAKIILCVYLNDISGNNELLLFCVTNLQTVYKVVLDNYNNVCPVDNKLEYSYNDLDEVAILTL